MPDRILIIEDEPSLSKELASALTEAGFVVVNVSNYLEALSKLDELKPDMVIVDEALGESMEVCYQLHSTFGIAVILLGKDCGDEIWAKALVEAGADFYLRKPFSHLELAARVKAILRRYKKSMAQRG